MESLELFGTEVLPEFAERDESSTRDKAQRLAPVIDAGDGRASPRRITRRCRRADYEFPAIPRGMADRFGNDDFHERLDDFAEQSALGGGGESTTSSADP